jgi:hypothetical protein
MLMMMNIEKQFVDDHHDTFAEKMISMMMKKWIKQVKEAEMNEI